MGREEAALKALVTGGGGFLGSAVVRALCARGDEVRSFSRADYPALTAAGVEQVRGDLADADAVTGAVAGSDVVFHVAARAGIWGRFEDYHAPNVVGTDNVIAACRRHGVRKLVFTSSPSVVFHGADAEGVDESEPYPSRFLAHYPATKATAERAVMAAADAHLASVSLRPHLIWGPGDNHLLPRLVERARAGKLRLVGSGRNLVDSVWIEDAARAHLLAAERLEPGAPISGRAYFISQGEPWAMADLVNGLLAAAGEPPVTRHVPPKLAWAVGLGFEAAWTLAGIRREPPLTRFLARQLATAHWFDLTNARRDLGYEPSLSIRAGLDQLAAHLQASATPVTP